MHTASFRIRLALALLMLPGLAAAQASDPDAPAAPASAPPAPVQLPATPQPARPQPAQPLSVAAPLPGLESRTEGGWRLRFPDAAGLDLPAGTQASLAELGKRLARQPTGRVTVIAQASGPANDVSIARRTSLDRGLAVKQALIAGGLDTTRIDIRPAGRTDEVTDAADILPPPPPRERQARGPAP